MSSSLIFCEYNWEGKSTKLSGSKLFVWLKDCGRFAEEVLWRVKWARYKFPAQSQYIFTWQPHTSSHTNATIIVIFRKGLGKKSTLKFVGRVWNPLHRFPFCATHIAAVAQRCIIGPPTNFLKMNSRPFCHFYHFLSASQSKVFNHKWIMSISHWQKMF